MDENQKTLYEFPLNERIRVFMRLEQLFNQIDFFLDGKSAWESRAVITSLLEIVTIFSRNDLKSEILKEVDRQINILNKMSASFKSLDSSVLESTVSALNNVGEELYRTPGKIGASLLENDLFKCISQRSSIPGGTCAFDLPAYHFWLQRPESIRTQDLCAWLRPFRVIRDGITLLLGYIRNSSSPSVEYCKSGFFQKTLDHSLPYQLLRVGIDRDQPYFAEISGGKHRFTIRFMAISSTERPVQTEESIEFQLTCCML